MRDPKRIHKFCNQLAEVWSKVPDWRFGQLVVNVLGRDPFYIEDDRAMKCFEIYFDEVYKDKNKDNDNKSNESEENKIDNNYASILCEYCPYTEYGTKPSEYVSGNGTYVSCEGRNCEEAYGNYLEETGDNTLFEKLF